MKDEQPMTRQEAVELIDSHKNSKNMISPLDLLQWTWLRVIVNNISDEAWEAGLKKALETLSQ